MLGALLIEADAVIEQILFGNNTPKIRFIVNSIVKNSLTTYNKINQDGKEKGF